MNNMVRKNNTTPKPKSTEEIKTVDPDNKTVTSKTDDSLSTSVNNDADRKQDNLAKIEPPEKKKRMSWKQEAKTLQAKLDSQTADVVKTSPAQMKLITNGLFSVVEGLSGLPITQVNDTLKSSFDESAALCMDTYVSPAIGKHQALAQLGMLSVLIVTEALKIRSESMNNNTLPEINNSSSDTIKSTKSTKSTDDLPDEKLRLAPVE